MKKVSKLLLIVMIGMLLITGCKSKNEENQEVEKDTVATELVSAFEEHIKNEKDIEKVANAISTNENIKITVEVVNVEKGFLDGFDGEIKEFSRAYAIKPIIGSQPFIAYIFETNDATALKDLLKEKANKRWNICTEADELEISVVDNYVFLVMSPTNFDE